ncbi:hypothetical protein BU15DRAFT_75271 [Melanogaster broomeanus]|nr:hypothetical protein BU15DRAFT_75271 [Melanogaster broomeanus]
MASIDHPDVTKTLRWANNDSMSSTGHPGAVAKRLRRANDISTSSISHPDDTKRLRRANDNSTSSIGHPDVAETDDDEYNSPANGRTGHNTNLKDMEFKFSEIAAPRDAVEQWAVLL